MLQKLIWPFTVRINRINCSSDQNFFSDFWPSVSNVKSFSWSPKHFFSQKVRTILETKYHFLCKNKEKVTRKKKCKHLQLSGRLHVSFYTMMRKFLRWRTQSTIVCSSYGCWTFGDSFLSLGETLSKWQRPEHVMQRKS